MMASPAVRKQEEQFSTRRIRVGSFDGEGAVVSGRTANKLDFSSGPLPTRHRKVSRPGSRAVIKTKSRKNCALSYEGAVSSGRILKKDKYCDPARLLNIALPALEIIIERMSAHLE